MEGKLEDGTLVVRASGPLSARKMLSVAGVSSYLSYQKTDKGVKCSLVDRTNEEDMPFGVFIGNARVKKWIKQNKKKFIRGKGKASDNMETEDTEESEDDTASTDDETDVDNTSDVIVGGKAYAIPDEPDKSVGSIYVMCHVLDRQVTDDGVKYKCAICSDRHEKIQWVPAIRVVSYDGIDHNIRQAVKQCLKDGEVESIPGLIQVVAQQVGLDIGTVQTWVVDPEEVHYLLDGIEKLESMLQSKNGQLKNADKSYERLQQSYATNVGELMSTKAELMSTKTELATTNGLYQLSTRALTHKDNEMNHLRRTANEMTMFARQAEEDAGVLVEEMEDALEEANETIHDLATDKDELKGSLNVKTQEVDRLNEQLTSAELQLKKEWNKHEKMTVATDQLATENGTLKSSLGMKSQAVDNLNEQLTRTKVELNDEQIKRDEIATENGTLKRSLNVKSQAVDNLNEQLTHTQQQKQQMERMLLEMKKQQKESQESMERERTEASRKLERLREEHRLTLERMKEEMSKERQLMNEKAFAGLRRNSELYEQIEKQKQGEIVQNESENGGWRSWLPWNRSA